MKLSELNLNENILKGMDEAGFTEFLDVQAKTIPLVLEGKDVLVQSQTGTGKTAAFLLPIFQLISLNNHNGMALIIVPTRELAIQVEKEAKKLGKYSGYKTVSIYGGVGYSEQESLLKEGAQIIIATPGRLLDLNSRGKINFNKMDYIVIDEADSLFDMGFMPDIKKIFKRLKPKEERMTMLFSATLKYQVKNLARDYMKNVAEVEINPENMTVANINQVLFHVGKNEKINLLLGLIQRDNICNGIIFVNTKSEAYEISSRLKYCGIKSEYLIGDLPQAKRSKIIEDFKSKKFPLLIATDVASRGLHIEDLELVINYDLPLDSESYVHRIGRTARVGKSGKAITFACEEYVSGLKSIEDYIQMKIPVEWADDKLFVEDKSANLKFQLEKSPLSSKAPKTRQKREHISSNGTKKIHGNGTKKIGSRQYQSSQARNKASRPNRAQNEKMGSERQSSKYNLGSDYWQSKKNTGAKRKEIPQRKKGISLNERLEYHKRKYGEDFSAGNTQSREEKKWKGFLFLKKISNSLFRKYSV